MKGKPLLKASYLGSSNFQVQSNANAGSPILFVSLLLLFVIMQSTIWPLDIFIRKIAKVVANRGTG